MTPATLQQAERLRCVLGGRDRVVVGLMAYAGLRPGEVRALQWGDVTGRAIVVRRAVGGDGLVKDTKSGSVRTVPLLAPLAADLDEVRGRSGLVVDIRDWPGWARVFRRGLRDVGMAGAFHPYALRHTFASLMIAEGRVPHEVARLLGHSTPQLTLSTYGHLFDEAQLRPGEDTEAAIGRARHEASEWFIERASAVRLSGP